MDLRPGQAQGRGSFRVQLLIFTEKKLYRMVGVDIEHVQNIAAQIDRYIPNVFSNYDPFALSYELEKLFDKNREEFWAFYENERKRRADQTLRRVDCFWPRTGVYFMVSREERLTS